MGSEIAILILADDSISAYHAIAHTQRAIVDFEHRFSRFLPESELSRMNRTEGSFHASPDMIALLAAAQQWHAKTGGIFDPTVIASLETLGYTRSIDFSQGPAFDTTEPDIEDLREKFSARVPFSALHIDANIQTTSAPPGLRIDLGGIGKGYIVDACATEIAQTHKNFWLSAGGDICVSGTNCGESWSIGVQDPFVPAEDIGYITIEKDTRKALATSGVIKRKGVKGSVAWHHIIDPRTGMPADNDIVSVTVLTPTVTAADILAKTVLILGKEKGIKYIDQYPETGCCIIDKNGTITLSDYMKNHFTARS